MQLTISQLECLVRSICQSRNLSVPTAELMVADYVGAHRAGKVSHGAAKLLLLDDALAEREGAPIVEHRHGALIGVNGHGSLGHEVAALAIDLASETAAATGIAAVAFWNFTRYGRLKPIGEALAERGFAAIIANGGGPAAIAAPGAITPILGTNPICLAIPGSPPFVADLATSERPWGAIREALVSGKPLPSDVFLDANGAFTQDPASVSAVIPFGGWKGFALATALELLTGAMVAGKVGTEIEGQLDLAGWIVAIKADAFRPFEDVSNSVSSLRGQIAETQSGSPPRSVNRGNDIEIPDSLHEQLIAMAGGASFRGFSTKLTD